MFSHPLFKFFIITATCSTAHVQALTSGEYLIQSPRTGIYARNFPGGTQQGPTLNAITFGLLGPNTGPYASWDVQESAAGWTVTNAASRNKAYTAMEEPGALVEGFSEVATPFSIETAGEGTWVIKAVNADLLWTIGEDGFGQSVALLQPASGDQNQKFVFIQT